MKTINLFKQLVGVLLTTLMAGNVYAACSANVDMGGNSIINVGNIDTISINGLAFPAVAGTTGQRLATDGAGTIDWSDALVDSGWINVPSSDFLDSWSNFGSGFVDASYRKIGYLVEVRGVLSYAGSDANASIFVLPAGYRPEGGGGKVVSAYADTSEVVRMQIDSTGNIELRDFDTSSAWLAFQFTFFG